MKISYRLLLPRCLMLVAMMLLADCLSQRVVAQTAVVDTGVSGSAISATLPWVELFDGETQFGWRGHKSIDVKVEGDILQVQTTGDPLFRTSAQFSDFQLEFEVNSRSLADDATVFLRSSPSPRNMDRDGVVIPLCCIGKLGGPAWQSVQIRCAEDRVTSSIDGRQSVPDSNIVPGRGYIGLRASGKPLRVRNIRLKPLGLKSMIQSGDLSAWNTDQLMDATAGFDEDGSLRLQSGKGQLESRSKFADFVLQVNCRTNTPGMNSGIFFRSIPGEFSNGYESQIQNEFVAGDRTKPKDCGTGGIFRRCDARRIVASDGEWFTKTIVASGNHFGVWVNGVQVTDWSDNRPAHANPRRGQRREAGTIILQAHDPTTDISFRQFDVVELRPR